MLKKIALEYSTLTSRKAKAIKRLDTWIKKTARITSIIIGLLSIFLFIVGFIIHLNLLGMIAIIGVIANPFIFTIILHKQKNKVHMMFYCSHKMLLINNKTKNHRYLICGFLLVSKVCN